MKAVPVPVALAVEAVPAAEVHEAAQADHRMAAAVAQVKVANVPNVRSVLSNACGETLGMRAVFSSRSHSFSAFSRCSSFWCRLVSGEALAAGSERIRTGG